MNDRNRESYSKMHYTTVESIFPLREWTLVCCDATAKNAHPMLGNLFVSQFRRKPRMEDQKRTLDSEVFCIGIFAQKCLRQRPVVFQIGQNSNFRCFDLFDG